MKSKKSVTGKQRRSSRKRAQVSFPYQQNLLSWNEIKRCTRNKQAK